MTKRCRWRGPPRAGGSFGSCGGKQPRGARGLSQMGAVPALCTQLLLWCLPHAGAQGTSTEGPAPGTECGMARDRDPAGASVLGAMPAPGRDPGFSWAAHTAQGGAPGPPLLSLQGKELLGWHRRVARLSLQLPGMG